MKTLSIFKAKVIEVIDGDTFRGEVNLGFDIRITRSFRVFGIDAPEIFCPKSDMERVFLVLCSSCEFWYLRGVNLSLCQVLRR